MKGKFACIAPLLLAFFLVTGTAVAPNPDKAMVSIDGQEVTPEGTLRFKRDDTVYLKAEGIKPHSNVNIKAKKAGIRWVQHDFKVDETGGVEGIMHMPEQKLKVTCTVTYYDADNTFNEVKFKFQTY